MLKNIDWHAYKNELGRSSQPILLCFLKNIADHHHLLASLEELSHHFPEIEFLVVPVREHKHFYDEFHFFGTPMFIFLWNMIERGRLLGSVSSEGLRAFIEGNIVRSITAQRALLAQQGLDTKVNI